MFLKSTFINRSAALVGFRSRISDQLFNTQSNKVNLLNRGLHTFSKRGQLANFGGIQGLIKVRMFSSQDHVNDVEVETEDQSKGLLSQYRLIPVAEHPIFPGSS